MSSSNAPRTISLTNSGIQGSSKDNIETVIIADDDDDDDIICEDVIVCDKNQSQKQASNSSNSDVVFLKKDETSDTKSDDTNTKSAVSGPSLTNSSPAEPMVLDVVKHNKCENDSQSQNVNVDNNKDKKSILPSADNGPQEDNKKAPGGLVDLSDDNDEPEVLAGGVGTSRKSRKDRHGNTCINFNCKSGENLSKAAAFVLTHFGLKNKRNKQQEVCAECFELAVNHQEKIAGRLSMNKCLLDTTFPLINDSVIVLDSDEEGSDVEEALLPEVLLSIEKMLPSVMDKAFEKYDLTYHLNESQNYLSAKLSQMELEMKNVDKEIEETQKCLDEWRAKIYEPYQPTIQNQESVDIVDVFNPPQSNPPSLAPFSSKDSSKGPPNVHLVKQLLDQQQRQRQLAKQHPDSLRYLQQQQQVQQRQQQVQQQQQQQNQRIVRTYGSQHQQQTQKQGLQNQARGTNLTAEAKGVAVKKVGPHKIILRSEPQDVVALENVSVSHEPLPPVGQIRRPRPRVDDLVYVMKTSFFGAWATGRIMEVIEKTDQTNTPQVLYKVRMDHSNRRAFSMKTVPGRHLAYPKPSPVLLTVGTRVIAVFEDDETNIERAVGDTMGRPGNYYSGLIVEPPKSNNKFRYLVFFDDGYAQYVKHDRILLVCESSRNVWEDIHHKSRDFIKSYLERYPERPMVKLQPGQVVKTEWDGKWWIARVIQVDGSLVKMNFDADDRTEWIYRGSTRLAPLYAAQAQAQARAEGGSISRMRGFGMATFKKPNTPYVEYTGSGGQEDERPQTITIPVRAVAKKSTSKRPESALNQLQRSPTPVYIPQEGHVQEIRLPVGVPLPKMFVPHQCGPNCIEWVRFNRDMMYSYNPLSIPLLCGWQRELLKFRGKRAVMYTAPCGRRLRNMKELHRYLRLANSTMTVDLFDFDAWVHALAEYVLINERTRKQIDIKIHDDDLSMGAEKVAIPLVNYVDHTRPSCVTYSTKRMPKDGVPLEQNPDPAFLCGCDCTDDCQDKEKCACWQLTIEGTALHPPGVADPTVGYVYRRLPDRVITGIYECNSRCKCSKTCLNRVVQHPLQLKLQLFKTPDKGWGIRCINDIPQGTFICIYAGELLTEQQANEEGAKYGDDYLAELDYIEVVERMKEGYESDVEDDFLNQDDDDDSRAEDNSHNERHSEDSPEKNAKDSDEDFRPATSATSKASDGASSIRSRLRKRAAEDDLMDGSKGKDDSDVEKRKRSSSYKGNRRGSADGAGGSDEDESMRVPSSFTAQTVVGGGVEPKSKRLQSVRKSFGPRENVYIMDANHMGNIGRYLNHSCSPNVFVQNVFVDTHDLRFPWVAFFALTYIRAGAELTWDYSYDVGSVPDKQIQCRCGSAECRGRLI